MQLEDPKSSGYLKSRSEIHKFAAEATQNRHETAKLACINPPWPNRSEIWDLVCAVEIWNPLDIWNLRSGSCRDLSSRAKKIEIKVCFSRVMQPLEYVPPVPTYLPSRVRSPSTNKQPHPGVQTFCHHWIANQKTTVAISSNQVSEISKEWLN